MGYSKEIYEQAMATLREHRALEALRTDERKQAFFGQYPRAREIEKELSSTAIQAAKAVLKGRGTQETLQELREHNQALQQEFDALLSEAGLPSDYLEPHYQCAQCRDEGFIDGKMCACLKVRMRTEACRKLNAQTPLSLSTFESFDLKYYSSTPEPGQKTAPREHMEQVFQYCKNYAEQFSMASPSLLFRGGTGLSKTHLSLAIANVVIQNGYGVIYDSVHNIMTTLERERFGKEPAPEDTNRLLMECDLLILDDLGTEFSTSFVTASIYNLVNTRLMAQRPTIISTNLTLTELEKRYTERLISRIIGHYVRLPFYGKDIRQQKTAERYLKQKPTPHHP